jgi:hypothetical protein
MKKKAKYVRPPRIKELMMMGVLPILSDKVPIYSWTGIDAAEDKATMIPIWVSEAKNFVDSLA